MSFILYCRNKRVIEFQIITSLSCKKKLKVDPTFYLTKYTKCIYINDIVDNIVHCPSIARKHIRHFSERNTARIKQ